MTQHASMKVCPNCQAPNPARQVACFSCGYVLNNPVAAVSMESVAFYRSGGEPQYEAVTPLPPVEATILPGWAIETLPDASIRLRRTGWRRFSDTVTLPAVCLILGGLLLGQGLGRDHADLPDSLLAQHLIGAAVLVVGLAIVAWQFGAREEIRAGRGFFERRLSLGPIVRRWRFDRAAEIYARTYQGADRGSAYTRRRLSIKDLGQEMTLDRRQWRDKSLGIDACKTVVDDEISALGRFLSEVTGWPYVDPALPDRRGW